MSFSDGNSTKQLFNFNHVWLDIQFYSNKY